MDPLLKLNTMSQNPRPDKERVKAEKTAGQFEQMFVRTMVSSLRETASFGDEGMFGKGPGSDTFADWFDQHLAEQVSSSNNVGIAKQLLVDLERHGEIPADLQKKARDAADRTFLTAHNALGNGGLNVVL